MEAVISKRDGPNFVPKLEAQSLVLSLWLSSLQYAFKCIHLRIKHHTIIGLVRASNVVEEGVVAADQDLLTRAYGEDS
jgi:uncharacterized membrane protein